MYCISFVHVLESGDEQQRLKLFSRQGMYNWYFEQITYGELSILSFDMCKSWGSKIKRNMLISWNDHFCIYACFIIWFDSFHHFVARCQPWTIILTGASVIASSWLIWHSVVVTVVILSLICTWWYIFLYSYPQVCASSAGVWFFK